MAAGKDDIGPQGEDRSFEDHAAQVSDADIAGVMDSAGKAPPASGTRGRPAAVDDSTDAAQADPPEGGGRASR